MVGFSGVDVRGSAGQPFGVKLLAERPWMESPVEREAENGTYRIDKLRPVADAMRSLRAAVELLAGRKGCHRAVMSVDVNSLMSMEDRFVEEVGSMPKSMRERLVVEIDTRGAEILRELADISRVLQDECGVTVAVLTTCESVDRIEELVGAMEPGILSLDGRCIGRAVDSGNRIAVLDAIEVGVQSGALMMALGVDTPEALEAIKDVGFDLMCGRAVSNVRSLVAGDFTNNVHVMGRRDRRASAAAQA